MPRNRRRYLFLGLSLIWMAVIFYFSGQTGGQSGALSSSVSGFLRLPERLVRKGAHAAEYAVLGALYMGVSDSCSGTGWWKYAAPFLAAAVYAASDELHQMFSAGRTPAFGDVALDCAGAAFGILAAAALLAWKRKRKENI